jgi:hypothetical protein
VFDSLRARHSFQPFCKPLPLTGGASRALDLALLGLWDHPNQGRRFSLSKAAPPMDTINGCRRRQPRGQP